MQSIAHDLMLWRKNAPPYLADGSIGALVSVNYGMKEKARESGNVLLNKSMDGILDSNVFKLLPGQRKTPTIGTAISMNTLITKSSLRCKQ